MGLLKGPQAGRGKPASKSKKVDRTNYTDAWLQARFKQLMKLDLIELPEEFYQDDLFFKEADELDKKFITLEEDNLFYIHRIQEYEQYIEDAQYKIDQTHKIITDKMVALEENQNNLVTKIQENQNNLEQYKKHTTGSKIVDQNSVLNKQPTTK